MRESPRIRRLRSDHRALIETREVSSVLDFECQGDPPDRYLIRFHGKGLWRPTGTHDVLVRQLHEVRVELGASYPRMMPELQWKSPIFHPNISAGGIVCLGGYGTHWVPSLNLDELCEMLWDMMRYKNYDTESPYNREAAMWARHQEEYRLPVDPRPMRDRKAVQKPAATPAASSSPQTVPPQVSRAAGGNGTADDGLVIIDDVEIVDAEIVETENQDIVFLD